jgi:hypothetical protein
MPELKPLSENKLLFEEHLPEFVLDMSVSTHSQVMGFVWFFRSCIAGLFFTMGYLAIFGSDNVRYIATAVGGLGIVLLLFASEWLMRKNRMASVPVRLYSDYIVMHVFLYERIIGFNGHILKGDIERIEIKRDKMWQRLNRQYRFQFWENAPIIYDIITKKGKRHSSGLKPPGQVIAITNFIRERWDVPIIDNGTGPSKMTEYDNGKPIAVKELSTE